MQSVRFFRPLLKKGVIPKICILFLICLQLFQTQHERFRETRIRSGIFDQHDTLATLIQIVLHRSEHGCIRTTTTRWCERVHFQNSMLIDKHILTRLQHGSEPLENVTQTVREKNIANSNSERSTGVETKTEIQPTTLQVKMHDISHSCTVLDTFLKSTAQQKLDLVQNHDTQSRWIVVVQTQTHPSPTNMKHPSSCSKIR